MKNKDIETLRKNVHENTDAKRSGVDLVMGIVALVERVKDDKERKELLTALKDSANELSEAVCANTPRTAPVVPGAPVAKTATPTPAHQVAADSVVSGVPKGAVVAGPSGATDKPAA